MGPIMASLVRSLLQRCRVDPQTMRLVFGRTNAQKQQAQMDDLVATTTRPTTTLSSVFPIREPSAFAPLSTHLDTPIYLEELESNKRNQDISNNQAPNRPIPWSPSQRSRVDAMSGPRFTQIDFAKQVVHSRGLHPFCDIASARCCSCTCRHTAGPAS